MAFEVTLVPKENIELGVTQKAVFTLSNVTPTIPVPGPKGDKGDKGDTGPQGPQGLPGTGVNSTDDVPEGDVNLYYTEERVEAVIAVTPPASHTHIADDIDDFDDRVFDVLAERIIAGNAVTITDNVTEGSILIDVNVPNATGTNNGLLTASDFTKIQGIQAGAEVNVNADWNATSGDAQILNKPTIVSSVGANAPIISSGGSNPTISTSMATNRLIGRTTDGSGVMEEISVGTGLQLSAGTLSATTIPGAGITKATASGTDTYTATITGVSAYADGDTYLVRFTNGNTTGATLNINSLGAKTLYRNNDGALIGGDITSGSEMLCVYNSTLNGFQCIGTAPNSLFAYVTNVDSVTITKGQPVYAFGGQGDRLTVKRAQNTGDSTSAQTVGLVASDSIAANQKGLIIVQGLLDGLSILPQSTWTDGDPVYLGATAGTITNIKPSAPNHLVYLGFVTTASNGSAGRLYVRPQNGYELQELHNVALSSPPNNNDGLFYETATSLWKNKSISTVLGYTPENVANKSDSYTVSSSTTYATTKAVVDGLATKLNTSLKGASNGLAELDGTGKVPTSQLPAYVDDVLEYANIGALPATGSAGIIYVTLDDNKIYRWSGTAYTVISDTIALGETSATAYRGDRGKIAYDHSQIITGNPHGTTKADIGLGNVDNTSDANKPVSTATQTALNAKVDANTAITGATKTKITYDSKGLVTAGSDATTADISESTNKLYVSDGDKGDITVSGNGTIWTIDNQVVTFAKMQNVATGTLFGRTDAGSGIAGSITIGTGLTGSASTLTANLSVGVNNGQSVIGGARASENLTLSSTSNVTKGKIILGSLSAYDEANNRLGIGTQSPTSAIHFALPTNLSGTQNAMYLSSAFDATATGTKSFIIYDLTTAGGNGNTYGLTLNLLPGLTGTWSTQAIRIINTNTTSPTFDPFIGSGNSGATVSSSGAGGGANYGMSTTALNALFNIGNRARAAGGTTANSTNVGVLGIGNVGTSTGTVYQIGGYFTLETVTPTLTFSAALACDNGTATNDIFVARDNGTAVFTIADGGAVNSTGNITVPDSAYGASWNGDNTVPTKNAIYDKIETLGGGGGSYTFSTGLTNTAGTVTSNLSTGIAGGQSVIGGTAASNNLTLSSTSNATKGKILFGTSAYDEVNNRLGINQTTPTARLQINNNQNSITNVDTNGLILANSTAAILGTQSASPPIVLQGNSWSTGSNNSNDIRFRIEMIALQTGTSNVGDGLLRISVSGNGGTTYNTQYSFSSNGTLTGGTFAGNLAGAVAGINTQIHSAGSTSTAPFSYRTTNTGSDITARAYFGSSAVTAGTKTYTFDVNTGIGIGGGNGTRQITRASIDIANLTNTAGAETGDLIFSTKPSGSAITEKLRISAVGDFTFFDGGNFILGATTGTKIGTATSQKIGFWNATPIVQPTTAVGAANLVSNAGTAITSTDTFDGYTLQQIVKALRNIGLLE